MSDSILPTDITPEIKNGCALAGDDYDQEKLKRWYAVEAETEYDVINNNSAPLIGEEKGNDVWHQYARMVNENLGFSKMVFDKNASISLLVLGPASGEEIEKFVDEHKEINLNFIEASQSYQSILRKKYPESNIFAPSISGDIELEDGTQNVVIAFSVLHHIANVSFVLSEIFRVMAKNGFLLIREPCSSMGDWRYHRKLPSLNERGISYSWMMKKAKEVGFVTMCKPVPILYAPFHTFLNRTHLGDFLPLNWYYFIDRTVSYAARICDYYWRDVFYKKFGPSSYFYVFLKKP